MENQEKETFTQVAEITEENLNFIGKRILFKQEAATVKYAGILIHDVKSSKIKADDLWFGVEWDNKEKGKLTLIIFKIRKT